MASSHQPSFVIQAQVSDRTGLHPPETAPSDIIPQHSQGQPLDERTRGFMESRFGEDFGQVRVHTDAPAADSAKAMHADAYTNGKRVYFAEGKYAPDSTDGQRLLAHELAHTVQQGEGPTPTSVAAKGHDEVAIASANDPLEREADQAADAVIHNQGAVPLHIQQSNAGIQRQETKGPGVISKIISGGESLLEDGFWRVIRAVAPALEPYLRNPSRIWTEAVDGVAQALSNLLSNILAPLRSLDPLGNIQRSLALLISGATEFVQKGDCQPLSTAIQHIRQQLSTLAQPVIEEAQHRLEEMKLLLRSAGTKLLQPVWDLFKQFGGGAWNVISQIGNGINRAYEGLRALGGAALTRLKHMVGWDEENSSEGVWDWIKRKVTKAWDGAKERLASWMGPLKTIGTAVAALSPFGPILLAIRYVPRIVQALSQLYEELHVPERFAVAKEKVAGIMPAIAETLVKVGEYFAMFPAVVAAGLDRLAGPLKVGVEKLTAAPLLRLAAGALTWTVQRLQEGAKWFSEVVHYASVKVVGALHGISDVARHIGDVAGKLIVIVAQPQQIPLMLAGALWVQFPKCFKLPILNWLLDLLIRIVERIPATPLLGPLAVLFQRAVLGFLRRIRGDKDNQDEKVKITDRIARLMGGTAEYMLGLAWGLVKGVGEGLLMPFMLLYDIITIIPRVIDFIESLPHRIANLLRYIGQEIRAGVNAAITGFWPMVQRFLNTPGGGILQFLQSVWEGIASGAESVGGAAASAFIGFIMLTDFALGEKLGWVAGTVLFEVVLGFITGGASVLLESASVPLRMLGKLLRVIVRAHEIMNEVFGLLFKALKPIGSFLKKIPGLSALEAKVEAIFKSIQGLTERATRAGEEFAGRIAGQEALTTARAAKTATSGAAEVADEVGDAATHSAGEQPKRTSGEAPQQTPIQESQTPRETPRELTPPSQPEPTSHRESLMEPPAPRSAEGNVKLRETSPETPSSRDASVRESSHIESKELRPREIQNELDHIADHPELVTGTSPNRRAKVGDHEWVENPNGGWCRHSNGEICVLNTPIKSDTVHGAAETKPASPIEKPNQVELSPGEQRLQQFGDEVLAARENATAALRKRELAERISGRRSPEWNQAQKEFEQASTADIQARNRLEAERQAQGITPEQLYDRLRGRTPNAEMNRVANSRGSIDPIYGHPVNGSLSPDHIVPVSDIVRMKGFEKLPPDMQVEILNLTENTMGMDPRLNFSKGDRLWSASPGSSRYWEGHPDFPPISPEVRKQMAQQEARARAALEKEIQQRLDQLGIS